MMMKIFSSLWCKIALLTLFLLMAWFLYIFISPSKIRNDEDVMKVYEKKLSFVKSLNEETALMLVRLKPDAQTALKGGRSQVSQLDVLTAAGAIGSEEICEYLKNKGFDFSSDRPLRFAALGGHVKTMDYLMSQGMPAKEILVYQAAIGGNRPACEYLIEKGISINPTRLLARMCRLSQRENDELYFLVQCCKSKKITRSEWDKSVLDASKFLHEQGANLKDAKLKKAIPSISNPELKKWLQNQ